MVFGRYKYSSKVDSIIEESVIVMGCGNIETTNQNQTKTIRNAPEEVSP